MDNFTGENLMACNEFTLRTADIQEMFYFNHYSVDGARLGWEDFPERMVDGIVTGSAAVTYINNRIQWCDENTSPIDRDTTVTKVEIRAFSDCGDSCGTLTAYLKPIFTLGNGDSHSYLPTGVGIPAYWSDWIDITNDTNAPATWTWTDINNLDVDHWMVRTICGDPNFMVTARIEIRVTWYDSVVLSYPLEDALDNKLDKQLKKFNLWRDYKLADEGIAGQPLNLEGVEVGVVETGDNLYATCFPLCFPICFNQFVGKSAAQMAQEKFQKIHSWIENNYNVVLYEFGDCFNAEYTIKDFTVNSMQHPSNYLWKLSLEKVKN